MIKKDNVLKFDNLSRFDNIIHGFSTIFFGSLRPSDPEYHQHLEKFSQALGMTTDTLVRMNQIHSNTVYCVTDNDRGQTIPKTDGLITSNTNVFLGVITADCVPLLFYDQKTQIVAAVHAGWRGLFAEIIKVAISEMVSRGSDPKDILVGLGPSIQVCCYEVSEEFVENFREKLDDIEKFVEHRDGKIFVNLQKIAKKQLAAVGVLEENIEDADYCTFDQKDLYSYRREGKNFGEIVGVIGIK